MSSRRIERCYTDNIYLIECIPPEEEYLLERSYLIMGNSGRMYQVTISNSPSCTCPDYTNRLNRCKHIYFVLMRIMNISNYSEEEYSDEELEKMFLNIPPVAKNLMYQGEKPVEEKEVNQKFEKGDICPICLDSLENGKELDYCKYSCGQTIHKKCFSMWEKSKGGICVFCRAKWYSNILIKNPKKVSMHPIERNQIEIKEDNNNNNLKTEELNDDKISKIEEIKNDPISPKNEEIKNDSNNSKNEENDSNNLKNNELKNDSNNPKNEEIKNVSNNSKIEEIKNDSNNLKNEEIKNDSNNPKIEEINNNSINLKVEEKDKTEKMEIEEKQDEKVNTKDKIKIIKKTDKKKKRNKRINKGKNKSRSRSRSLNKIKES